jgi:glycosyltransferase involved in cell wall biosynthesis
VVKRVRITDVNPFFYPWTGGIEHRMHDTARLLSSRGHDVTILTSRLPGTPEEERTEFGYRVVRLKSRFVNVYNPPFVSSSDVLENLRSLDADVVSYNYRWAPSYNRDVARYDGGKVFTVHNMWGEGAGLQAPISEINDRIFVNRCLRTFDHVITVSEDARRATIGKGVPPERVTTVPNCLSSYPETNDEEGDFILSLGRMVRVKGLGHLVEAMRRVECRLLICGKGPDAARISRKIRALGLQDRVEMRGWVTEEEKVRLMSTCRMFVIPSLSEAFGIAAMEQMSYGRPVISTNVNGLPETVGDGGILVDPGDPGGLADAINSLLSDGDLRQELRRKARARAEYFSWDNHIGRLEEVLLSVAAGEPAPPSHGPVPSGK